MAYISYNKLLESEFEGIVSKRNKLQDLIINHLKLEVQDTYEKDEKISTNFKPTDSDVINKGYLDEKLEKKMDIYPTLKNRTTSLNYNTTNNL